MKHLIVGDNHGFHKNLQKLLIQEGVINKKGQAINRDEFKVYCTGDLIDGQMNRAGDILNLQLMEEWFDAVCIGNHEYAFLGGRDFGTKRKNDRETVRLLLQRLDEGRLVPSIVVHGHLLTHAGLSKEFGFQTVEDANVFINTMWEAAPETDGTVAIFDWKNNSDYTNYNTQDPTSGIFNLAWKKDRNENFPQIVGHTILENGPIENVQDTGFSHWNIDVGAKSGQAAGGIIIDDETNEVIPVFWGQRKFEKDTGTPKSLTSAYTKDYDWDEECYYHGLRVPKLEDNEDFLDSSSITNTNINLGDRLMSAWGEIFRITKINRGTEEVTLKSEKDNKKEIIKSLDSDWSAGFRRIKTINLVDDNVTRLGHKLLDDDEVMSYFRNEVSNT